MVRAIIILVLFFLPFSLFAADTTPPIGTILINDGTASTSSTAVTLKLSADDSYTDFLLHADGTDGLASYTAETGQPLSFAGNAQLDTAQKKFGSASLLFNGSGDYVTVPDSSDWNFGSGDFTIDLWARWSSVKSSGLIAQTSSALNHIELRYYSGNNSLALVYNNGGALTTFCTQTFTPTVNTWYHIAVVRSGNNAYLFINGVQGPIANVSGKTLPDVASPFYIGYDINDNFFMNGWIDEVRISKGIARWTSGFSPPVEPCTTDPGMGQGSQMQFSNDNSTWSTAENYAITKNWTLPSGEGTKTVYAKFKDPAGNWSNAISDSIVLTNPAPDSTPPKGTISINNGSESTNNINVTLKLSADDSYTNFLLHADGIDGATSAAAVTGQSLIFAGNAQLDTAQKKFGSASLLFDGSGDYATVSDSGDWNFGGSDFTIDLWVRWQSIQNSGLISQYVSPTSHIELRYYVPNKSLALVYSSGGALTTFCTQEFTPSQDTWYHIAIVRNGNNAYTFINGVQLGQAASVAGKTLPDVANPLVIGYDQSDNFYMKGWIDELRVSKGIARWTSNFSPPEVPCTTDPGMGAGSQMQFSNDNSNWSSPIDYASTATWTLASGDGEKKVYAKFKDPAGNWSSSVSDAIVLDTTAPVGTVLINNGDPTTDESDVVLDLSIKEPYTKFLFHSDGFDRATSTTAETGQPLSFAGNAQLDTAQKKFGSASLLFNGSGDYVTVPDSSDWNFGSGDFTIDLWARWSSVKSSGLIAQTSSALNHIELRYYSGNNSLALVYNNGGALTTFCTQTFTPTVNTWYHIAVVRSGNNAYLFINGVQGPVANVSGKTLPDVASPLYIGYDINDNFFMNGWIDELRISKGIARWTSGFSPFSQPYILDSDIGVGSQMRFSNDNTNWSDAESYAVTKSWELSSGFGTKTVYAKFKDGAGNWSQSYSDTITFLNVPKERIYINFNGRCVAMKENGKKFFYHNDHLGSTSVVTNESGEQIKYIEYKPYGDTKVEEGTKKLSKKFTGKELDKSTGLYDYAARMYDPKLGRFISADTAGIDFSNPQTLNRYSYCLNNPLRYIDPTGHTWEEFKKGFGSGGYKSIIAASVTMLAVAALSEVTIPAAIVTWGGYTLATIGGASLGLSTGAAITGTDIRGNKLNDYQRGELTGGSAVGWGLVGVGAYGQIKQSGSLFGLAPKVEYNGKGGSIALGRFTDMESIETFAKDHNARLLRDPFPRGVSLKQGLQAEIDAAKEIHFNMKDVKPGSVSYDIEYNYIRSKPELLGKTKFYNTGSGKE